MFKALKPTLAASIIAASFSFNAFAAEIEKSTFSSLGVQVVAGT